MNTGDVAVAAAAAHADVTIAVHNTAAASNLFIRQYSTRVPRVTYAVLAVVPRNDTPGLDARIGMT